jgi:4-hydroxy-3-methylbut-2-enyl diphosphate reductase
VKAIGARADLFLVVGSTNSSNSLRMVEVARDHGARAAYLVEDATAIDPAWLDGVATVGLSSGASVPEILVTDVLAWLAERGYDEVEEVSAADEKQSFALPRELRRLSAGA